MGHSMGGHGALICALKNPGRYSSVSAFAPICNPCACPWGLKAFSGYLGSDPDVKDTLWKSYDATELVPGYKGADKLKILVDSGLKDDFYKQGQLLPENFVEACKSAPGVEAEVRLQEDYDHSYFFVSSFVGEHLAFHAKNL
jgi:S-formylglutathione hydrolase